MFHYVLSPDPISSQPLKPVPSLSLAAGKVDEFNMYLAVKEGDNHPYTVKTLSINIPAGCFQKDAQNTLQFYWNKSASPLKVPAPKKVSSGGGAFYVFDLPVPTSSKFSTKTGIHITCKNLKVTTTSGAGGNISVKLKCHIGPPFIGNTFRVTTKATTKSTTLVNLSPIQVNQGEQHELNNTIHPSILDQSSLVVPITNTVQFKFIWEQTAAAPLQSPDGAFLITFDYGNNIDLAVNQLVCNNPNLPTPTNRMTVFNWSGVIVKSKYVTGTLKNKPTKDRPIARSSIAWTLAPPTDKSKSGLAIGTWQLTPNQPVFWKEKFSVTLEFSNIVSSNSSTELQSSNAYVQSVKVDQLSDVFVAGAFYIKPTTPQILDFQPIDGKPGNFTYQTFGTSLPLLSWQNQNGLSPLNGDKQQKGDLLYEKKIGTLGFALANQGSWRLFYKGSVSGIDSTLSRPELYLHALDLVSGKEVHQAPYYSANTPFPTSSPTFELIKDSVKNLGPITYGGTTYTLLSWQATGLGIHGFCTLSDQESIELSGSTEAGKAPYYHLYKGTPSSLTLTACKTGDPRGKKATISIPTQKSDSPFVEAAMDICYFKNAVYAVYQGSGSIYINDTTDGFNWNKPKPIGNSIPNGKASLTTDGKKMYLNVYSIHTGRNIWTSTDGKTWTSTGMEMLCSNPEQMEIGWLHPSHKKMSAVYLSAGAGYVANTDAMYKPIASDVKSGLSFTYFKGSDKKENYYVAYQNTDQKLTLLKCGTFMKNSYTSVSLPDIHTATVPQIVVFQSKLVIVYAMAGTNQLAYISSLDGIKWNAPKLISLTAASFSVTPFYNMLCITYLKGLSGESTDLATYLMLESEL